MSRPVDPALDTGSSASENADPLVAAAESAGPATFVVDERGRITEWDRAAEALYGFSAYEVVGRHPTMLVPPELDFERDEYLRAILSGRSVPHCETERMRKDGTRIDVVIELSPVRQASGRIVGARVEVRQLTRTAVDRQAGTDRADTAPAPRDERSQRRLADAQERFRVAFVQAPNGIALLSTAAGSEGSFLAANPALARQLGYDGEDLIGRCLLDFLHPESAADETETLGALLEATEADARAERRFLRGDGRDVWLEIGASVVRDDAGRLLYAVAHLQDVTDARRHQAELRHLADHDSLTGLVNRRCFGERLEAALAELHGCGRCAAVLVLDLDKFKAVNDTCGHAAGDELLHRVGAALRSRVRSSDVVARLGGDEFGILLTDVTPEGARDVAAELLAAVDREATVSTAGRSVRVTASIGVSTIDSATSRSGEILLSDADTAMYQAKRTGRNRFATTAGPERRVRQAPSTRRARRVEPAAASAQLELWEQPLLNLAGGACDHTELLARMRGRRGEDIPAERFLPILKRFGRAQDVDRWVFEAAVALVSRRQSAGMASDVEINLDAASVTDEHFVESLRATLAGARLDAGLITFGVTAAAFISDIASARRLMSSLGELGCRLTLDHFGASAGSLRDLRQLPGRPWCASVEDRTVRVAHADARGAPRPYRRPLMRETRTGDERDVLIARLEEENAQLVERLARLRPALHGLTEDLVRAHRDTAEWRRRYRELAARSDASRRRELVGLPARRDAA